jgi:hypothetical protein
MSSKKKILDIITSFDYAKLFNNKKTKVRLRKSKKFGLEVVCSKPIRKGETVAYYRFKVHRESTNVPYKEGMYNMTVFSKKDNGSRSLIGDLYSGSLEMPDKNNISYYAFFCNEPSGKDQENCFLDVELKHNYRWRKLVKEGEIMRYSLKALRPIKKGERVVWCYGESYMREYPTNCD